MPTQPRRMTKETLNALYGWPSPSAVEHVAKFASTVTARVPPGACVSLNSDGEFILGVGNDAVMPMFTFAASDDPDIQNYGGNPATEKGVFIGISPSGNMMALPACGAYELVSTHYVDDDYLPNDMLTSPKTTDNAGKIMAGTRGTNMGIGLVSRGIVNNGYGHDAIAFWPLLIFPDVA